MAHAFVGTIVCIKKPWLPFRRHGLFIHGKAVVLGGNEAALCSYLNAWLVLPAMAKF